LATILTVIDAISIPPSASLLAAPFFIPPAAHENTGLKLLAALPLPSLRIPALRGGDSTEHGVGERAGERAVDEVEAGMEGGDLLALAAAAHDLCARACVNAVRDILGVPARPMSRCLWVRA
jgi:hypothetical protein